MAFISIPDERIEVADAVWLDIRKNINTRSGRTISIDAWLCQGASDDDCREFYVSPYDIDALIKALQDIKERNLEVKNERKPRK